MQVLHKSARKRAQRLQAAIIAARTIFGQGKLTDVERGLRAILRETEAKLNARQKRIA